MAPTQRAGEPRGSVSTQKLFHPGATKMAMVPPAASGERLRRLGPQANSGGPLNTGKLSGPKWRKPLQSGKQNRKRMMRSNSSASLKLPESEA